MSPNIQRILAAASRNGDSFGYRIDPSCNARVWSSKEDNKFEAVSGKLSLNLSVGDFVAPLHRLTIRDQDFFPSCVGFGIRAAIQQQLLEDYEVAPMPIWYNSRKQHGDGGNVTGTYISAALYSLEQDGFCKEEESSYTLDVDAATHRPDVRAMMAGDAHRIAGSDYHRCMDIVEIEQVIRAGCVVIIGRSVGTEFAQYRGGEEDVLAEIGSNLGGHCTVLAGVRVRRRGGIIRKEFALVNSWGEVWGGPLTDMNGHRLPGGTAWLDEKNVEDVNDAWAILLNQQERLP